MRPLFTLLTLLVVGCAGNENRAVNESVLPGTPAPTEQKAFDTANLNKDAVVARAKNADPISVIREKVRIINTLNLQQRHFEFMCDEKMKVDYFYKGKDILKITVDYGTIGDVYAREDYYYDAGKLIFNYEFVEGGPACEGCIRKNEYRSYISNNTVIKYLKDQQAAECRKCEFGPLAKQYKLLKAQNQEQIKALLCR